MLDIKYLRSFLLFLPLFWSQISSATTLDALAGRYFLNGQELPLSYSILGPSCYALRSLKRAPPCNPAMLVTREDTRIGFHLSAGEDYQFFSRNQDLIRGENKREIAQKLLYENKNVRLEVASQIFAILPSFSFTLLPGRWTYYSGIINSSYPDLAIHAMQEQGAQVQFGTALTPELSLGLSFRAVERKFVHETLNLFDAVGDPSSHFHLKTQQVYLIQPGLLFEKDNAAFTFHLSNLGIREGGKTEQAYKDPVYDFGFSFAPELEQDRGQLEMSLSYRYVDLLEQERRLRGSLVYELNSQELLLSLAENEISLGAFSDFFMLQSGIMLRRRHESLLPGENKKDDTLSLEINGSVDLF